MSSCRDLLWVDIISRACMNIKFLFGSFAAVTFEWNKWSTEKLIRKKLEINNSTYYHHHHHHHFKILPVVWFDNKVCVTSGVCTEFFGTTGGVVCKLTVLLIWLSIWKKIVSYEDENVIKLKNNHGAGTVKSSHYQSDYQISNFQILQ